MRQIADNRTLTNLSSVIFPYTYFLSLEVDYDYDIRSTRPMTSTTEQDHTIEGYEYYYLNFQ